MILSVTNRIRLSELRAAIVRDYRMKAFSPPQGTLVEFCRQVPGLHVCDDAVEARPRINQAEILSPIENQIVRILSGHGRPMIVPDL
jgi:hypothetical protein